MLNKLMKSVLEQDKAPIVICDLEHTIVYMNPAAIKNYEKSGGADLIGSNLLDCHNERSCGIIKKVIEWYMESEDNNIIYTFHNDKKNKDVYMVALRDDDKKLIGYYEKHEFRDIEQSQTYDFK